MQGIGPSRNNIFYSCFAKYAASATKGLIYVHLSHSQAFGHQTPPPTFIFMLMSNNLPHFDVSQWKNTVFFAITELPFFDASHINPHSHIAQMPYKQK